MLSKFAGMTLALLRDWVARLEKWEHGDPFDERWVMHISLEFSCGPKSEIPRGGYLRGNDVVTQDTYRTFDGKACFEFRFHRQSVIYEVEVVSVPFNDIAALSGVEGRMIPPGNPPVRTYPQARKLAKVWAEYVWRHIKKECPLYREGRFQEAEEERCEETPERYYDPDVYGRKVVRMR